MERKGERETEGGDGKMDIGCLGLQFCTPNSNGTKKMKGGTSV